jgi:hypothetical protein
MKIERDRDGDQYWIVESTSDLQGWHILYSGESKPGVTVLHATRDISFGGGSEFRILYCPTELAPKTPL